MRDDYEFHVIDNKTGLIADIDEIALNPDNDPDNDFAADLCYCDMEGFLLGEDGTLYLADECGRWVYPPEDRFKVVFGTFDEAIAQTRLKE